MLKNILKLDGAQQLSKNEQKSINGGLTVACANAWSHMSCTNSTLANCRIAVGSYFCGKCCF